MDIEGENGCEAESGGAEGCVAAGKAEKGYGIMKKLSKEGGWWIGGSIHSVCRKASWTEEDVSCSAVST